MNFDFDKWKSWIIHQGTLSVFDKGVSDAQVFHYKLTDEGIGTRVMGPRNDPAADH